MGKKNKKAKKFLRDQALKQIKQETKKDQISDATTADKEIAPDSEIAAEFKETRGHIKKILITVGILVLLIVAIYLVNIKSDFILSFGQWFAKVLNINI